MINKNILLTQNKMRCEKEEKFYFEYKIREHNINKGSYRVSFGLKII